MPALHPALSKPCCDVTSRCFLITGGTQGLGLAIARHLKECGAAGLVLVSRSQEKGEVAVKELTRTAKKHRGNGGDATKTKTVASTCQVEYICADLSNAEQAESVVPKAVELLGGRVISGVVNCAATTDRGNLFTTTPDLFDHQMALNVRAPFLITQGAAKHMIEKKIAGSIVNICSCAAYGGAPFVMAYSASKAALVALTKNNAAELAPKGIRVNGINMGWCYTDNEDALQTKQTDSNWIQRADASVPLGRILRPQDVAVSVGFLLSDSAAMTTGTIMELHPEYPHGMISLADADER